MSDSISYVGEKGKGRAIVVLYQGDHFIAASDPSFYSHMVETNRIVEFRINADLFSRAEIAEQLRETLAAHNVRQAFFVASGLACEVVQMLCLSDKKLVRSAMFVDPEFKKESDLWSRWITRADRYLPFGLPFRQRSNGCGISSFYQRLTCPTVIVLNSGASDSVRKFATEMCRQQPTSWLVEQDLYSDQADLAGLIRDFSEIPARCPQKARS